RAWEASGFFNPDKLPDRNQKGESYCVVMPPPNRTGTLHMGHAVMLAIQDLLIRFERMRGKKTLWIPGTDHAAIATQVKVEQMLMKEGMKNPREELGREKFLEKVVAFAEESSKTINKQIRKMGSSCDWSRERYTLDEARNQAVNEVFKMMYEDGLIERGARIVNWDPNTQTVVSDDEVVWVEEKAPFFEFQYGPFVIGTSRPETKFGDKYVVMHPDDTRYQKYQQGEKLTVEWINGPIEATIIKDEAVDREFGTGVMTITPWHDMTDFEIAERHHLTKEQVIDLHGNLLPIAGEFESMHIKEARQKVVEKLKKKGLLVNINENYIHRIATCSRGGGMIEPQILKQWFIRVTKPFALRQDTLGKWKKGDQVTLKELMREVVTSKQVTIIPERFEKIYFHWIDHLRDWCISRQIWFGHRIPVWYHHSSQVSADSLQPDKMIVSDTSPGKDWQQDPDTLDTWFSSGLWTFSTLGWPDKKEWSSLRQYHPTALLETGYDILFFWVARMILMTTYTLGEIPFKDVYLHGLVRDEQGRKMSKSLGNILDPLDLIPKYGTDAVRLSLMIGSTPGQDTRLSEAKIEGFRNFTNKLWNISRFILSVIARSES
ncbi:MAG: valine--tRNA ligase, partial [Candidatus Uhrbacteria bacterium]|nr:valine--tRNA ligase [Candidatus Uhrbacteria bacterium]